MTPQEIIQKTSLATDIPIAVITGASRVRELVMVRHFLMWVMQFRFKMTPASIGAYFDRDRTCVIHACRNVNNYLKTNDELYMPIHEMLDRKLFRPIHTGGYCNHCIIHIFNKQRT